MRRHLRPALRRLGRRPGRRPVVAGVLVALLLPLAGCGGPDYCGALEADRKKIADMIGVGSTTALLDNLPLWRDLAEKAPEDLTDEWQAFVGALEGLDEALDHAGVKRSEYKGGKPPAGLDAPDQKAIADAASQLAEVSDEVAGIEQQARDVCKVNLGL